MRSAAHADGVPKKGNFRIQSKNLFSLGSIEQRLLAVATGGSTSSDEGGAGEQQLRLHLTTLAEQQGVRVKLPLLIVDHLPSPPPLYPHPSGISAVAVLFERRRLLRGLEAVAASEFSKFSMEDA